MPTAIPKVKSLTQRVNTYPSHSPRFTTSFYEGQTAIKEPVQYATEEKNFQRLYRGTPLPDFKLMRATFAGTGWEYEWHVDTASFKMGAYLANRGLQFSVDEYSDYQGGVTGRKAKKQRLYALTLSGAGFVKDEGGVTSLRLPGGRSGLRVIAATPDYSLGKVMLPAMPYLNRNKATAERNEWPALNRADSYATLGYQAIGNYDRTLYGPGSSQALVALNAPFTADPFAGFANFRDGYTMEPGGLMTPVPANENHIIAPLSEIHALKEVLDHHVFVGTAVPYPLFSAFLHEFDYAGSVETDMIYTTAGPGSAQDIIRQAAQRNYYRYWWDAQCVFHFITDYCTRTSVLPAMTIVDGPSMLGELHVTLGTAADKVINRVVVQGQALAGFETDGDEDALTAYFSNSRGSVYPPGRLPAENGNDIIITDYPGKNTALAARREFARASRRTTATLTGFPFFNIALGLANQIVAIQCKDPLGSFDWSVTPKYFSVDGVDIVRQEPDAAGGGYFTSTLSMTEIITLPS